MWFFKFLLPTCTRLQDKGVPCSDICPHCKTNYENDWHVFMGCDAAKQVWQEAGLWKKISEGAVNATLQLAWQHFCFLFSADFPSMSAVTYQWCYGAFDVVWMTKCGRQNNCLSVQRCSRPIIHFVNGAQLVCSPKHPNSSKMLWWKWNGNHR